MVDVDKAIRNFTVNRFEVHFAGQALRAVNSDGLVAQFGITFKSSTVDNFLAAFFTNRCQTIIRSNVLDGIDNIHACNPRYGPEDIVTRLANTITPKIVLTRVWDCLQCLSGKSMWNGL
ncbi:hypothetical protein ASC97_29830 [Rhizobium sp. Root1203]|nr:hypothetical protein ASC97_29830 [Rhizobium sp. Root1203]